MATQGRYGGSEFTKTYSLKYLDPYIASQETWRDVKVSQGQGSVGGGGADLQSSTHRISDQLLLLYRKIPIISPGLTQLRDGRLGGLINRGGLYSWRGLKKGLEKSYGSAGQNQPHLQCHGKAPWRRGWIKIIFEQINFTSIQARGGLIFGRGVITGCIFLFAGRWAYKWGVLISGRCL